MPTPHGVASLLQVLRAGGFLLGVALAAIAPAAADAATLVVGPDGRHHTTIAAGDVLRILE